MPHPLELISRVCSDLWRMYPPGVFDYVFERALAGTKMFPDIQVHRNQKPVCVVEIGYTRPEKLTAYRDMGVPDVRWYDKAGQLHLNWFCGKRGGKTDDYHTRH